MELFRGFPAKLVFSRGSRCTDSIRIQGPIYVVSITSKSLIFGGENVPLHNNKSNIDQSLML